jgi:hypothetical protein
MTKKTLKISDFQRLLAHEHLLDPMLRTIKSHPAWKDGFDLTKSDNLLQDCPPFCYILRQGESSYQFFLSYKEETQKVKHVSFKIELTIRKWSYRNGTGIIGDDLDEFIPLVMHCKKSQCHPMV